MTKKILLLILFLSFTTLASATDWCSDANCKGCWRLNVNEDPVSDDSGEGHTGSVTGATFIASAKYGGGYSFNGSSQRIDFGNITESEGAENTVVAWVYNDNITQDHIVIGNYGGTSGILLWFDDSAGGSGRTDTYTAFVRESSGNGQSFVRVEGANSAGVATTWQHVAQTTDCGSTTGLRLYVDGTEDANSPGNLSTVQDSGSTDAGDLQLGESPAGSYDRAGDIDEVALFDDIKDSTDINDMITNGLNGTGEAAERRIFMISMEALCHKQTANGS